MPDKKKIFFWLDPEIFNQIKHLLIQIECNPNCCSAQISISINYQLFSQLFTFIRLKEFSHVFTKYSLEMCEIYEVYSIAKAGRRFTRCSRCCPCCHSCSENSKTKIKMRYGFQCPSRFMCYAIFF